MEDALRLPVMEISLSQGRCVVEWVETRKRSYGIMITPESFSQFLSNSGLTISVVSHHPFVSGGLFSENCIAAIFNFVLRTGIFSKLHTKNTDISILHIPLAIHFHGFCLSRSAFRNGHYKLPPFRLPTL